MSIDLEHESLRFMRSQIVRRFETRVFRVKVDWDGGDYYLSAMIQKNEWTNVDHLGELGWEFVTFVPNHEAYISDSFEDSELPFIRMAVFKRELAEGEEMWTDFKAR
jgi:hypothetical protein